CVEASHAVAFYDLGGLGVSGILAAGAPPAKVRAVVDRALATARADRIARALEGRYAAPGPDAIGWAIEHAGTDTSVEKLAAALGHTPRSLRQALEDAGLPGPTRVLLWGRLLLAGARLGRDGRTVEEVAYSLGYSAANSLARAMKRQTGLTPGEVSERGGMERVRDALFPPCAEPRARRRGTLGRIAVLALALVPSYGCAGLAAGAAGVDREAIEELIERPPVGRSHFGIHVVDVRTGRTLYERQADRWFVPGSNQKLLATAAAWSLLGPDYRYRTEVWAAGEIAGGELRGDLVVVGSGDPSLSDRWWESGTAALDSLAGLVRAAGIRHVSGGLFVDVSAWDSTTVGPTREVADLEYGYGATGGAFVIDEGEVDVVVRAKGRVGEPVQVEWSPLGTGWFVRSELRVAPATELTDVRAAYLPQSRQLVLEGQVAKGTQDTLAFAQRDPVREATAALARALERAGVRVRGGAHVRWTLDDHVGFACAGLEVSACPRASPVAVLRSPPLSELTAAALGPSQNWIAEQLLLTLGAELGERGSWPEGLRVVDRFLIDEVGLDSLDVGTRDGSGLSAYNLVTPRAIARVLRHMAARPDAAAYRLALAEPGEKDSTLEERLEDLEGRVFAKTGSISNVNTLSGYLFRENGDALAFSILSNGARVRADEVRATIDDIVRVLAR
ncbi:MAG TPA: D-alanyl-D-alanine carboxypeptidase/D-alanyl-D-alanine-endopeptidase, partial [Longimicrobiales bacterium]|nr:D-alanyl-D-alanine carboxypeptidase/D-alanyl-D-alanine-endopeptidase [Longimicrobiales bacterium]